MPLGPEERGKVHDAVMSSNEVINWSHGYDPGHFNNPERIPIKPFIQKEREITPHHEIVGKSIPKFRDSGENQDCIVVTPNGVGVFDGVSGSNDGGMAAYIAAEKVRGMLLEGTMKFENAEQAEKFARQVLAAAIDNVETEGKKQMENGVDRRKVMMTTACIVIFWEESITGKRYITGINSGDCRFLKISKDGELEPITVDNQHENFPLRHVSASRERLLELQKKLSEAKTKENYNSLDYDARQLHDSNLFVSNLLGRDTGRDFRPSTFTLQDESSEGAQYLMHSDGVTANLTDPEIINVLMQKDKTKEEKIEDLINLAEKISKMKKSDDNMRPKPDDISAILIAVQTEINKLIATPK